MTIISETTEEKITRLFESRNLLFQHIIKFGCITRCHNQLFKKIDDQLHELGICLEDVE